MAVLHCRASQTCEIERPVRRTVSIGEAERRRGGLRGGGESFRGGGEGLRGGGEGLRGGGEGVRGGGEGGRKTSTSKSGPLTFRYSLVRGRERRREGGIYLVGESRRGAVTRRREGRGRSWRSWRRWRTWYSWNEGSWRTERCTQKQVGRRLVED